MVDGSTKTMMLRVSIAAALLLGGSITASFAAGDTAPAVTEIQADAAPAAADATLPRFDPSQAEAEFADTFDAAFEDTADSAAAADEAVAEDLGSGVASWYGARFAGRKTASGEAFDPGEYTAAHRTLPFGSHVRVSRGDKSVIVRINDRGPFHGDRVIDLSRAAAAKLGLVSAGSGQVTLARLD
jgi:rare lipoprotein A